MLFKDVIGQQQVKLRLLSMVQHNRLSHALLFLGKTGSGTLPLALAFAQYVCLLPNQQTRANALFNEAPQLPATPDQADSWMQVQPSFLKAQQMMHPDLHYTYPVVVKKPGTVPLSSDYAAEWRQFISQQPYGSVYDWLQFLGAENKQGNITAQECNDILRKLNLKSFESGFKALVLWMPEYLGKEGNKLLKMIEEPPENTLFILVAENETGILSTILSRCQLVKIPALAQHDVEQALINREHCPPGKARHIAGASNGNYCEALQILQNADEDYFSLLKDWLNATLKYQVAAQLKFIDIVAKMGREKQKQFLRYFLHLTEQALRLQAAEAYWQPVLTQQLSAPEQDFTTRLNKIINLEQKNAIAEELNKAIYYIERNANSKILFHALTIKLFHIIKNHVVVNQ